MKMTFLIFVALTVLGGCASKGFDQRSYDRQNKAAEKSLNAL